MRLICSIIPVQSKFTKLTIHWTNDFRLGWGVFTCFRTRWLSLSSTLKLAFADFYPASTKRPLFRRCWLGKNPRDITNLSMLCKNFICRILSRDHGLPISIKITICIQQNLFRTQIKKRGCHTENIVFYGDVLCNVIVNKINSLHGCTSIPGTILNKTKFKLKLSEYLECFGPRQ